MRTHALLPLLALAVSCGTSSVASNVDIAGDYTATGTLKSNSCGGSPDQTATSTLTILGEDKAYTARTPAGDFSTEQTGNILTWTSDTPQSDANCTGKEHTQVQVAFNANGGTGTLTNSVTATCSDGSSGNCAVSYDLIYTKK